MVERLLTVAEVAKELRVSKMTVYRLVNDEVLASLRVGRSIRISEGSMMGYLRAGARG